MVDTPRENAPDQPKLPVPYDQYREAVKETQSDALAGDIEKNTGSFSTLNEAHLLATGPETFRNIEADMLAAKKSIKINIFSWAPDSTGVRLAEVLMDVHKKNPSVKMEIRADKLGSLLVGAKDELKSKMTGLAGLRLLASLSSYPNLNIGMIKDLQDDPGKIHTFSAQAKQELEAFMRAAATPELLLELNSPLKQMKDAGINVVIEDNGLARMDHSKIFIIDDSTVYGGGMNVGDDYSGGYEPGKGWTAKKADYWKDYMVKMQGPASDINRHLFFGENEFTPDKKSPASTLSPVCVLHNSGGEVPEGTSKEDEAKMKQITYATYKLIDSAKSEINIEHAYIMDQQVVDKLKARAAAGVKVTILRSKPESRGLEAVNEKFFSQLAGVRNIVIYNLPRISHTKLLTVDGKYSIVGSANLSRESLHYHEEVSFMVTGDNDLQKEIRRQFTDIAGVARVYSQRRAQILAGNKGSGKNKG